MADKGFEIVDLLTPKKCTLNIPPFLQNRKQFSPEEVEETQSIAQVRIHPERAIRRVKENHIFDNVLPHSFAGTINQIWVVSCLLTNLEDKYFEFAMNVEFCPVN